jgi:hypothetical protein
VGMRGYDQVKVFNAILFQIAFNSRTHVHGAAIN